MEREIEREEMGRVGGGVRMGMGLVPTLARIHTFILTEFFSFVRVLSVFCSFPRCLSCIYE